MASQLMLRDLESVAAARGQNSGNKQARVAHPLLRIASGDASVLLSK